MAEERRLSPARPTRGLPRLCRDLSERSPLAMVAVEGPRHVVSYVNPAFARLAGRPAAEMVGRPFAEAMPEGESNGCLPLLDRVLRTGAYECLAEQEHGQAPPGGSAAPVYWTYAAWAILGADDRPVGVMVQVTDSTEAAVFRCRVTAMNEALVVSSVQQHELTEAAEALSADLRDARDRLEDRVRERTAELVRSQEQTLQAERLAVIGRTVTALAHEGRNALQRAAGCLERLGWRLEGRPEEQDLAGRALRALGDLERLFEDVRSYAAPLRLDVQTCDLRQVWREAWAQVAALHAQRDALLEEMTGEGSLACAADPFRLGQVFTNLFANALDACPDPVRVVVSCREAELEGCPALLVSVGDNGPGFTAEQRQRAFEPFLTTKPKGTGLGMAICKRIIVAHGGQIALAGNTGGAQILITLPRAKA